MVNMENYLAGIKKVEFASASDVTVANSEKMHRSVPVLVTGTFTEVCIDGLASVEYEVQRASGQNIYTTKLSFASRTKMQESFVNRHLVFRLTDMMGEVWLLGTPNKPFPVGTVRRSNIADPTTANIDSYEFVYINTYPILPIL